MPALFTSTSIRPAFAITSATASLHRRAIIDVELDELDCYARGRRLGSKRACPFEIAHRSEHAYRRAARTRPPRAYRNQNCSR